MRMLSVLAGTLLVIPQGGSILRNGQPPRADAPGHLLLAGRGVLSGSPTYRSAQAAFRSNAFQKSLEEYSLALRQAERKKDRQAQALAHWGLGTANFALRDYHGAWVHLLKGRAIFRRLGDSESVAGVEVNLSSLYAQLGELPAALEAGERSAKELAGRSRHPFAAHVFLNLGGIQAGLGRLDDAVRSFTEGIDAAINSADREMEATGWDKLGYQLLQAGRWAEAEEALVEAFRLRRLFRSSKLGVTREKLCLLKIEQGDLRAAASILGAAPSNLQPLPSQWGFYYAQGRLNWARGRLGRAVVDLRTATRLLMLQRDKVPPADALRLGADWVWQSVPKAFAEAAVSLSRKNRDPRLAEEALAVLEHHRAASLYARFGDLDRRQFERAPLPESLMRELGAAEGALLNVAKDGSSERFQRVRTEWIEAEAGNGRRNQPQAITEIRTLQRALGADEAFLSFALGSRRSALWTVTRGEVRTHELPERGRIAQWVARFREDLESGANSSPAGARLCEALFSGISAHVKSRPMWRLSLEQDLFALPFAALPCGESGQPLVVSHTFHLVPGAWIAGMPERPRSDRGWFLGVGDPIYNLADPRRKGPHPSHPTQEFLSRLPASGSELAACLETWRGPSHLLLGEQASRRYVREALRASPEIVHFATHIVHSPTPGSPNSFIGLSLSPGGDPELVGQTEISAGWRTNASLVVLSGCASGRGAVRSGSGLEGMTRAWLAAGAQSVLATLWPIRDYRESLFPVLYKQLQADPRAGVAAALRHAQLRAIAAGDWRSRPAYWAPYFLIGRW